MKGIYVQRYSSGEIFSVQVEGPGSSVAVTPEHYDAKGYEPPKDSLPDIDQYLGRAPSQTGWRALLGKRVRIRLAGAEYEGVILEDSDGGVGAIGGGSVSHGLLLQLDSGESLVFFPGAENVALFGLVAPNKKSSN